jgi:CheY-like chemotaxis protein
MLPRTVSDLGAGTALLVRERAEGRRYPLVLIEAEQIVVAEPAALEALSAALTLHRARAIMLGRRGQRPLVDQLAAALIGPSLSRPVRRHELYAACLDALTSVPSATLVPPSRTAPRVEPDGAGHRILVAEDNLVNQKVLVRMLRQRGHVVEAVETGELAAAAVARQAFDAVLMDCQMPGMDGFEATEVIRRWEQAQTTVAGAPETDWPRLPIIAVTASATARDRDRCLAAGMDDYISKPIDVVALDLVLGRWLNRARPTR